MPPSFYDIHGIIRVESAVPLPELESFRTSDSEGVSVKSIDVCIKVGSRPASVRHAAESDIQEARRHVRYKEGFGPTSFGVELYWSDTIDVWVSWLIGSSPHVLYTNVLEPILRWMFVTKGYALVHGACIASGKHAVLISAQTDTGKTTTILRTLDKYPYSFLSDDMIIMSPDGTLRSYPKPLTISSHTVSAVSKTRLSLKQKMALQIQSKIHSRSGRRFAHLMAKTGLSVASLNAIAQIVVPPPKYEIQDIVENVEFDDQAILSQIVFIERGKEKEEYLGTEEALKVLLRNCEDAYGFPPYEELSRFLLDSFDYDLAQEESNIIKMAMKDRPVLLLRKQNRDWWQGMPAILDKLTMKAHETAYDETSSPAKQSAVFTT